MNITSVSANGTPLRSNVDYFVPLVGEVVLPSTVSVGAAIEIQGTFQGESRVWHGIAPEGATRLAIGAGPAIRWG